MRAGSPPQPTGQRGGGQALAPGPAFDAAALPCSGENPRTEPTLRPGRVRVE